jgi:TolB protein
MGADGSGAHRITHDDAPEGNPAWSPDGRWLAYSRQLRENVRELWLVHPDGSQAHALTKLDVESTAPAWSPDGNRIAFQSNRGSSRIGLFVIGRDGRGLRRLTPRTDEDEFDPAWSPDGKTIAFSRDGAIVTLAGGTEQVVTNPRDNDSSPAWNPRPETEK